MQERQERVLEFIIQTLKKRSGEMEIYRLNIKIHKNSDPFFDTRALVEILNQRNLVNVNSNDTVSLTAEGWEFNSFSDIRKTNQEIEEAEVLKTKNLKLQNENLTLQNKHLKRYILYAIIGFVFGAILTNYSDILELIKN